MVNDMPNASRRHFLTLAGVSTAAALFSPQALVSQETLASAVPRKCLPACRRA